MLTSHIFKWRTGPQWKVNSDWLLAILRCWTAYEILLVNCNSKTSFMFEGQFYCNFHENVLKSEIFIFPCAARLPCMMDWDALSNALYRKNSTTRQGMQKGANFCATLILLYHTSDWLNQQTLAKLQVAVYIFMRNWSTIFLSTKPLLSLNTIVILCGEHWKIGSFYCLCLRLFWLVECFNTKETTFQNRV